MRVFNIFTVGLLLAAALIMAATFVMAYLNGGQVIVDVNQYGEAKAELCLIGVSLICGVVTLVNLLRRNV